METPFCGVPVTILVADVTSNLWKIETQNAGNRKETVRGQPVPRLEKDVHPSLLSQHQAGKAPTHFDIVEGSGYEGGSSTKKNSAVIKACIWPLKHCECPEDTAQILRAHAWDMTTSLYQKAL